MSDDEIIFQREVDKIVKCINSHKFSKKLIAIHPDILDDYRQFIFAIKEKLGDKVLIKKWNTMISSYAVIFKINEHHSYSMYPQLYTYEHIHMKIAEYHSQFR